ncbi:DUF459 domain-containing protein [Desulfolutivibrio sulfoxidireducens]|uniref:DUF459 domain-containing protein n=1 Tax=Desulfolutivibrio sulfoxidireducens TaxID=2773299 RepID=UPI00159E07F6|nr:DUF459 domain-containing protein [Desulfolutivibrio sulfoxidireducens]QLA20801.1 DUF459 domain-containing protein [Desulfolutivibrio sulfoxidireducens]
MHRKRPYPLVALFVLALALALPSMSARLFASVSAEPESSTLNRTSPDHRVVVIGDSLSIGLGKEIERVFAARQDVAFSRLGKVSSGLVKPEFFDWEKNAAKLGAKVQPDVIVVMIGANDNNNLTSPDGRTTYFTDPAWDQAYAARAALLVDACRAHNPGARVYFVGVPVMADPTLDRDVTRINAALETVCGRMENCVFLDTKNVLADGEGRFAPLAASPSGEMAALRLDDGVHVTSTGSRLLAARCLERIMADLGMDSGWRATLVADAGLRPVAAREAASIPAAETRTQARPEKNPVDTGDASRHLVRGGETLWSIAKQAKVGMAALVAANPGIDPDRLAEGQMVLFPANAAEVAVEAATPPEQVAAIPAEAPSPLAEGAPVPSVQTEAPAQVLATTTPAASRTEAVPVAEAGTYAVTPGDSVWTVAKKLGVSPRDLVRANAAIDPDKLALGQLLRLPASRTPEAPAETAKAPDAVAPGGYAVADGDNLWRIARRFGVTVASLKKANAGVRPEKLRPGQRLVMPEAENAQAEARPAPGQTVTAADGATAYAVAGGDTPWTVAKRFGVSVDQLLAANAGIDPKRLQIGQLLAIPGEDAPDVAKGREEFRDAAAVRVPIAKGDNLWTLARRYGLRVDDLVAANQGLDPMRLEIGRELVIPSREAAKAERERREAAVEVSVRQDGSVRVYNVADGDTLWNLSRRFGVSMERILDANAEVKPDRLAIGQVLQIPASVVAAARF